LVNELRSWECVFGSKWVLRMEKKNCFLWWCKEELSGGAGGGDDEIERDGKGGVSLFIR